MSTYNKDVLKALLIVIIMLTSLILFYLDFTEVSGLDRTMKLIIQFIPVAASFTLLTIFKR